jgi:hypothetical protein
VSNVKEIFSVRMATPEDEPGIMELCRILHKENGLFPLDEDKVRTIIRNVLIGNQGFIGVIGPKDNLEASILLSLSSMWYSNAPVLEEYWNFVHPDFRKSERARYMVSFAKTCADRMGIPLLIGIVSNDRTEAKCRLYKRMLPKAGEFYLYNPHAELAVKEA